MAVSADTLFHFTSNLNNLVSILSSSGFIPSYCVEHGWKRKIAVCQSCFCDIPLSEVKNHMETYGKYGLGMSKEWGVKNGISPVIYIIKDSFLQKNIWNLTKFSGQKKEELNKLLAMLKIHKGVNYIKDNSGRRNRKNNYSYYDEREWRYVPSDIEPKKLLFLDEESINDVSKLNNKKSCKSLMFAVEDIKYIIVESEQRDKLVAEIRKLPKYTEEEKIILISKIFTTELILKDI